MINSSEKQISWGRSSSPSIWSGLTMRLLFFSCPIVCFVFANANTKHNGSFLEMWNNFSFDKIHVSDWKTLDVTYFLGGWLLFQWMLALLPDICSKFLSFYRGGIQEGQLTPAGKILKYNINGLQSWIISHIVFIVCVYKGFINPNWIIDNWVLLFYGANFFGYILTILAYLKAKSFPTYPEDNKETGDIWYDIIMGVEFNPRILGMDLKLFFNGRPGIVGWTLLNLSFSYYQYSHFGFVSNGMIMLNLLQGLYVLDFFWNETWYLKTIDIAHEHFGFYLAWGDCVWLPWMYTLQGCYLAFHPVEHGIEGIFIMVVGILGYIIFRWTNYQKDYFRRRILELKKCHKIDDEKDSCQYINIWGKYPSYITCEYITADGKVRESHLLTSGWWGMARHMNYTGDIILSAMWGFCCGFNHILPHFYTLYIIALLVTRVYRDETRCREKYGSEIWGKYCKKVPYRFIPYLY